MGVPALFRWLSKKYPKIVNRVVEDTPTRVRGEEGDLVDVPIRYENPNPNGFEVDNLYLDMNGIVHPCTHPEGKPAPETEEEMMVEIFKYTERVVNMARPRKVLMMAIDGVAPRAKMNQQRARRFRAAQEAADKEEEKREAIKLFEAMGHPVSEETRSKKSWDTNAITPGTPFMDLLSSSLKYWVSQKLTNDPGWKDVKIIISDASVPGEGEHKIMDWIRRQRSHPEYDANTSHVIYGLDADLIMLSLATHEPHFRVLREDVFFQGSKQSQTCNICGEAGHFAANCKGEKKVVDPNVVEKANPVDPKPFIFLDVGILREYLTIELNITHTPFPFDLELAIDDWIFMIFFVGNDFLPHLPSLEIREGAIDTLLRIWKSELPRMGGYLTNHGKVEMARAQIILEGLAKSEDEIFQKRKEDEDRQDSNAKRRRIEDHKRQDDAKAAKEAGMKINGTEYVAVTPSATARGGPLHPSLPSRPAFDIVPKADVATSPVGGKKLSKNEAEAESLKLGLAAMGGSNEDVVKNRKAIRMANMSAAQMLKAELEGSGEDEADAGEEVDAAQMIAEEIDVEEKGNAAIVEAEETVPAIEESGSQVTGDIDVPSRPQSRSSRKRKAADDKEEDDEDEEEDGDDDGLEAPPDPEADQPTSKKKLKVNADGTVDYEDDVRLWEPGYRERYYEKKFGVPLTDKAFLKEITRSYIEGLCWVLEYYYQGVPAWDWYYPYHYAPFAQDFVDVGELKIDFKVGEPFKPFAQLLGVFPAASRIHLPEPLQLLMTEDDSPIIDFYPSDFDIDMNGKKMAWQGVALLPFIDQFRLLAALKSKEDQLTDDEKRRNRWGDNVLFVSEGNGLYDQFCGLYTLKAATRPIPIDVKLSPGVIGAVLSDPSCVPNSGLDSPLPSIPECPDLSSNASLSVRYYYPRQAHKHRSILLRGYKPRPPVLSESDKDFTRRGGPPRRGRGGGPPGGERYERTGPGMGHGNSRTQSPRNGNGYGNGYPSYNTPPPPPASYGYGSYGNSPATAPAYGGYGGNPYASSPYPPAPSGYGGYGAAPPVSSYGGYQPPPRNPSYGGNPYTAAPPAPYGGYQLPARQAYNGNPYTSLPPRPPQDGGPPPRRY